MERFRLKIKKLMATALSVVMMASMMPIGTAVANAAEAAKTIKVYLTVSNAGVLALANDGSLMGQKEIEVSDVDGNSGISINDVLLVAHKEFYGNDGYATEPGSDWKITKLWGVSNGGAYGYYVNNASAWSFLDPVNDGDSLDAFIYQDTSFYSDTYTFFDSTHKNVEGSKSVTLTLNASVYDSATGGYIKKTVPNVTVRCDDGEILGITDKKGKVTFNLYKAGAHIITADGLYNNGYMDTVITAPACVVTNTAKEASAKTKIKINNGKKYTAYAGDKFTLSLKPAVTDVTWKSSKPSIVKVDPKTGAIEARKKGSANIQVFIGGKKRASVSVTVKNTAPEEFTGVPTDKIYLSTKGKTSKTKLKVSLLPKTALQKWSFKSSKSSVVSVNSKGELKAKKEGTATITITAKEKDRNNKTVKAKVKVTVTPIVYQK
ncbi:MAG: Ig-like domain-containing protein [Lachnospiraceae bacterium]|nr:Ig-like domain-containing protein [Lachnospiraceae bacterium]